MENFLDFAQTTASLAQAIFIYKDRAAQLFHFVRNTLCLLQDGFASFLTPFPSYQPAAPPLPCMDEANPYKYD